MKNLQTIIEEKTKIAKSIKSQYPEINERISFNAIDYEGDPKEFLGINQVEQKEPRITVKLLYQGTVCRYMLQVFNDAVSLIIWSARTEKLN